MASPLLRWNRVDYLPGALTLLPLARNGYQLDSRRRVGLASGCVC
jgi:hypothetical protein